MVLLLTIHKYSYVLDNNTYIYFIDVGQGDSTLIKYKDKATLIDTGGKVKFKEDEWKKKKEYLYTDTNIIFFRSIGISNIGNLILTHGDQDHVGEVIYLVNKYKVKQVIFNQGSINELETKIIQVLDNKHIKYYKDVNKVDNMNILNTRIYLDENNNSNVIYLEVNNYKLLFMGDAGVEKEKDILDKYNLSNIDILKVGHHGSNTSSSKEFIDKINPKYSIISVGKNNRYGHPNQEVLDILNKSKIYRTDENGSIMFKIKNNKLKIKTCSP